MIPQQTMLITETENRMKRFQDMYTFTENVYTLGYCVYTFTENVYTQ